MKKDEKQQRAEELKNELAAADTVILSRFEGITVSQDYALRRKLAEAGAKYKVVKNSVIERAAQGTHAEPIATNLHGTTSLAYSTSDPVVLAKAITAYAKENPVLVFKAGIVQGRVIDMNELNAVAALPSREMLLGRVLFLINSPGQRLASALSAVGRNIAFVIQQGVEAKKFKEVSAAG
jgi:large subunit ribosomal protein L10